VIFTYGTLNLTFYISLHYITLQYLHDSPEAKYCVEVQQDLYVNVHCLHSDNDCLVFGGHSKVRTRTGEVCFKHTNWHAAECWEKAKAYRRKIKNRGHTD